MNPPVNDNRAPFWKRRLVRLVAFVSLLAGSVIYAWQSGLMT